MNLHLRVMLVLFTSQFVLCACTNCSSEVRCVCQQFLSGCVADCSGLNLSKSPKFYDKVTMVNLSINRLIEFPTARDFTSPSHVYNLDLSGNDLNDVSINSTNQLFASLINLEFLNLSRNYIPLDQLVLTKSTFADLRSLRALDLSFNNITRNAFPHLDDVFEDLTELNHLSLDAALNITFGPGFLKLTKLQSLKLQGRCHPHRLVTISEDYFHNLRHVKRLDLSSIYIYDVGFSFCSLLFINIGAISPLTELNYLDLSNNRELGVCGFKNVTMDLNSTKIHILKANLLHCEEGMPITLLCDDLKYLKNTSIVELYLDGNNLAYAETGILYNLPESLTHLSLRENRFVLGRYNYCNIQGLKNLMYVDISYMNTNRNYQYSGYPYCELFNRNIYCSIERGKHMTGNVIPFKENQCKNCSLSKFITERTYTTPNITSKNLICTFPYSYDASYTLVDIPKNLEHIVMNNSRLGYTFGWTVFTFDTLKSLIMSNNEFYTITGPICNVSNLLYLDLSNNHCSMWSNHVFNDMLSLKELFLNSNLIGYADILNTQSFNSFFAAQSKLEVLDLSSNLITGLHINVFWSLKNLRILRLNKNKLSDWTVRVSHMKHLKSLDLSENQILYISTTGINLLNALSSVDLTVNLTDNLFQCICDSKYFISWLMNKQHLFNFTNVQTYECQSQKFDGMANALMILEKDCADYAGLVVILACSVIGFIIVVISAILYKYRWKLRYWYYIAKRQCSSGYQKQIDDEDYRFDAFISYADEDRVFSKDFVKYLEVREEFKLCIHHRDFIPGCDIADNIINAIHQSRKVIFVLTDAFLNSKWCLFEVQMTITEYVESRQGRNMMVLVFKEDIPHHKLPNSIWQIIREEVYIEYPNDPENIRSFWEALIEALHQ